MRTVSIGRNTAFQIVLVLIVLCSTPGAAVRGQDDALPSTYDREGGRQNVTFQDIPEGSVLLAGLEQETGTLNPEPAELYPGELNTFPPICVEEAGPEVELIRLSVISTRFRCTESTCEHHYDSCLVEIDYELIAETREDLAFETAISCTADITYGTGHGYILKNSTEVTPEIHDLEPQTPHTFHTTMCFAFSRYEEVITAQLDSVQCRIQSVELKE